MDAHGPGTGPADGHGLHHVERLTAFTDAVVAIAMTLLILPLLDAVSDSASAGESTAQFVRGNLTRIGGFALSFAIIAAFWRRHHRVFGRFELATEAIVRLDVVWMFTIVWLPVATALVGTMPVDRLQAVLYVGAMAVTSWVLVAIDLLVRRDRRLWGSKEPAGTEDLAAAVSTGVLFMVALAGTVLWPRIGYLPLLLLFGTQPLAGWLAPRLESRTTT
ncbi:MAG: DUF1211 domain-containing protein [Actinobacteria bacterium]|nr:DUF1211 domain-containing protein [Actinomycetota bacterium]MCG2800129.1 TMEM175 family protein [Cellulomonas sp.]